MGVEINERPEKPKLNFTVTKEAVPESVLKALKDGVAPWQDEVRSLMRFLTCLKK
jgi:hypothetical protein